MCAIFLQGLRPSTPLSAACRPQQACRVRSSAGTTRGNVKSRRTRKGRGHCTAPLHPADPLTLLQVDGQHLDRIQQLRERQCSRSPIESGRAPRGPFQPSRGPSDSNFRPGLRPWTPLLGGLTAGARWGILGGNAPKKEGNSAFHSILTNFSSYMYSL